MDAGCRDDSRPAPEFADASAVPGAVHFAVAGFLELFPALVPDFPCAWASVDAAAELVDLVAKVVLALPAVHLPAPPVAVDDPLSQVLPDELQAALNLVQQDAHRPVAGPAQQFVRPAAGRRDAEPAPLAAWALLTLVLSVSKVWRLGQPEPLVEQLLERLASPLPESPQAQSVPLADEPPLVERLR